jgi:hypothetical protein
VTLVTRIAEDARASGRYAATLREAAIRSLFTSDEIAAE